MHWKTLSANTTRKLPAARLLGRRAAWFVATAGALLMAACGCRHVEHAEAEHHTPAHKPADYPAAVERLLELHVEIVDDRQRPPGELDAVAEAYDVARWLPELAADSDLTEQPWVRVQHAARRLENLLLPVLQQEAEARKDSYLAREPEWKALHQELLAVKQQFPREQPDESSELAAAGEEIGESDPDRGRGQISADTDEEVELADHQPSN